MNTNTGEIRELDQILESEMGDWVEVGNRATKRQRLEMQVSPHDNRSPLGKQFTQARKAKTSKSRARIAKQSRKKNR